MVTFTCNNCGDSAAKPKVEKHLQICKKKFLKPSLCCVDCLVDFNGYSYQDHNKCVTELERYSKPGFVMKSSSNKGERKQTSWLECIKLAASKPGLNHALITALNTIYGYKNVPRNKTKFNHFLKNSCHSIRYQYYDQLFELIDTTYKENVAVKNNSQPSNDSAEMTKNVTTSEESEKNNIIEADRGNIQENGNQTVTEQHESVVKLTERERKKKKKKDKSKLEIRNEAVSNVDDEYKENGLTTHRMETNTKINNFKRSNQFLAPNGNLEHSQDEIVIEKKKRKKNKFSATDAEFVANGLTADATYNNGDITNDITNDIKKPKESEKKVSNNSFDEDISRQEQNGNHLIDFEADEISVADQSSLNTLEESMDCSNQSINEGVRFKWKKTIVALVKAAPNCELSFKKLSKKIVSLYEEAAPSSTAIDVNTIIDILDKKIDACSSIKKDGRKVTLV